MEHLDQPTKRVTTCETISQVVSAMYWNSASKEDLEIVGCFLLFHEINESRVIQKPITECRVSLQLPQSTSQYAVSCKVDLEDHNKPWPQAPLIYFKSLKTSWK